MAQQVQVILVDDLDGGDADRTVTFAFDGTSYEIDLNDGNVERMRDALAPYVAHARKVGSRSGARGGRGRRRGSDARIPAIREWARSHGHQVNDRGRISAEVMAAYEKAHA